MPHYEYVGINDQGKKVEGKLEASSEGDLESRLNQMGYYILQAREIGTSARAGETTSQGGSFPLVIGLFGLVCTMVGVFVPFVSISLPNGEFSMAMFPCGFGLFVFLLTLIGVWLLLVKRYLTLLIPFVLSAILTVLNVGPFTFISSYKSTLTDKAVLKSLERTKPKEDVEQFKQFVGGMRIKWGLWLLATGHILVLVAIVAGRISRRRYFGNA
ncbi:MAG TPA: hypothetical protein ACFYED_02670 [Candidatus Tripitaka californicus]|uniref:hypothetical protein n=1 Tax=Candidatus Tripitaka californicus TaxID=3367616 RepID=UPI004026BB55|nr:hypothetical protein [Planctomycetota bacterium]